MSGESGGIPAEVKERAVDRLVRWTEISSASGDSYGLERMARHLVAEAESAGLAARIEREPDEEGRELPIVTIESSAPSSSPLFLIGHMDTVLAAAPPKRDGDRLLATGAIDMKGGLVAFFGALELHAARGGAVPELDLRLVVVPDEEIGGAISRRMVERNGGAARALWVLEPGELTEAGETIVAGRRGLFHWQLEARGRAAHSGAHFWDGRSAVAAAAEWCLEVAALSRPHDGPTVNLSRIVGGDRGFVDGLSERAGLLGTARELNVVPDRARVDGETRFLRAEEEENLRFQMEQAARRIGDRHGVPLRFMRGARIAPVDPARSGRDWIDRAVALAAAAGWTLEVEENRGGISFPNFLPADAALPVLDGLGPAGGGMHTREEFVSLLSLERRIALLADLLAADAASRETDA